MSERCPQITDDVTLVLTLPGAIEEWADELLAEEFEVWRDENDNLLVARRVGGNTNAVSCARMFLDEVEDILREGEVDPMDFTLSARSSAPASAPLGVAEETT